MAKQPAKSPARPKKAAVVLKAAQTPKPAAKGQLRFGEDGFEEAQHHQQYQQSSNGGKRARTLVDDDE